MKKTAWIGLAVFLLLSCDLDTSRTVRFYADSTSGLVSGNYLSSAGYNIFIDQPSPWSRDVETEKGDYVVLTVSGDLTDTLTAKIYVNGVLFRETIETGTILIQVAGYLE